MPYANVASCNCCGQTTGDCCLCMKGPTVIDGGCCYAPGDRMRLTLSRPGLPASYFGGTGAGFSNCINPPPALDPTYCCGSISTASESDMWVEYEFVEDGCLTEEIFEDAIINPTPCAEYLDPPGPGWLPPLPCPGDPPDEGGSADIYCHKIMVFAIVETSASFDAYVAGGGDGDCIFPLEFHFICAGCRKREGQRTCGYPDDFTPTTEQPCQYILPGDVIEYEDAKEARGWRIVCAPDTSDCPFCVGACLFGTEDTCTSITTHDEVILDEFGSPAACGLDACAGFPCTPLDTLEPDCLPVITFDISKCGGGQFCCYREFFAKISCDYEDGYDCIDLGTSIAVFERVNDPGCLWDTEEYRCRVVGSGESADPTEEAECPEL